MSVTWSDDDISRRIESVGTDLGATWRCRKGHAEPDEGDDFEAYDFYQARTRLDDGRHYVIDFDDSVATESWEIMRDVVEDEMLASRRR